MTSAYHHDLLQQARALALADPKRPRRANIRRAVSSAYYAVFHFLVDQSCRLQIGSLPRQAPYRQVLARAFSHSTMKIACVSYAGGTLNRSIANGLTANTVVTPEIRHIATAFVVSQQQRHLADYDLTEDFTRSNVLALIEQVEGAILDFELLPPSDEKSFFLVCLWAWRDLSHR